MNASSLDGNLGKKLKITHGHAQSPSHLQSLRNYLHLFNMVICTYSMYNYVVWAVSISDFNNPVYGMHNVNIYIYIKGAIKYMSN